MPRVKNQAKPTTQLRDKASEAEWLRVREFERRLSAMPLPQQEEVLRHLSFDEVYALFCATVAKNVEAGRLSEAL